MGRWTEIAENLKRRDDEQLQATIFHGGMTLENRLMLAEGRALDALSALISVLNNLDEIESASAPKPEE